MNQTFKDIVAAIGSFNSRDDIAIGLAGLTMCAASLSMFVAMFSGAM